MKKNAKKKIIMTISLIVFLVAAGILIFYVHDYYIGKKTYQKIEETVVKQEEGDITIDWETLQSFNRDVVGWIRTDNGEISYPIVQTTDNDYYLSHSFIKESRRSGAIFMDESNANDYTDDITYIYGHNMRDNSMFAALNKYEESSYYRASEGFTIYTPNHTYYYKIFSSYDANVVGVDFPVTFASEETQLEYLNQIKEESDWETSVGVDTKHPVVALFTCNGDDALRRVVYGIIADKQ